MKKLLAGVAGVVALLGIGTVVNTPKPLGCNLGCSAPAGCLCRALGVCGCEPDADCSSCGVCERRHSH